MKRKLKHTWYISIVFGSMIVLILTSIASLEHFYFISKQHAQNTKNMYEKTILTEQKETTDFYKVFELMKNFSEEYEQITATTTITTTIRSGIVHYQIFEKEIDETRFPIIATINKKDEQSSLPTLIMGELIYNEIKQYDDFDGTYRIGKQDFFIEKIMVEKGANGLYDNTIVVKMDDFITSGVENSCKFEVIIRIYKSTAFINSDNKQINEVLARSDLKYKIEDGIDTNIFEMKTLTINSLIGYLVEEFFLYFSLFFLLLVILILFWVQENEYIYIIKKTVGGSTKQLLRESFFEYFRILGLGYAIAIFVQYLMRQAVVIRVRPEVYVLLFLFTIFIAVFATSIFYLKIKRISAKDYLGKEGVNK